jgi:hypothetical protein
VRAFLCILVFCSLTSTVIGQTNSQPHPQPVTQPKPLTNAVVADYNERVTHCKQNPTDNVNCTAIRTAEGDLGIPRICPIASEDDQTRLTVFSMNLWTLDGLGTEEFEKMGWCKLSADEALKLYQWHLSRMPSRVYYDTNNRADKRIYIQVLFEEGVPDTAKSAFRSAMRQISDVEIIDEVDADFSIDVAVLAATSVGSNAQLGYASLITCTTTEKTPGNSPVMNYEKLVDCQHFSPSLNLMGSGAIDSTMREQVARIDTSEFEPFRKTWPYRRESGTK